MTIYHWYRIETTTVLGFPDMIGIAPQMDTVFCEIKVARSGRVKFSPHQIAMAKRLSEQSNNCYYVIVYDELAKPLHGGGEILYGARNVDNLQKNMKNEPRLAVGWPKIQEYLVKFHGKRAENQ